MRKTKKVFSNINYKKAGSILSIVSMIIGNIIIITEISKKSTADSVTGDYLFVFEAENHEWDSSQEVQDSDASGGWAITVDQTGTFDSYDFFVIDKYKNAMQQYQHFPLGEYKYYIRAKSTKNGYGSNELHE